MRTTLRRAGGGLVALLAVVGATGVLYLLREARIVGVGPEVHGALPLQQLAGGEAQPLGRMILAWVPAGLVGGLALSGIAGVRRLPGLACLLVLVIAVLVAAGAAADAIAVSDPVAPHLGPRLGSAATWVATLGFLTGSLAGWPPRRRRSPGAPAPSAP